MNEIVPKNGLKDWAAVTFVLGPNGQTVLVYEPNMRSPKWKLSGGKVEEVDMGIPQKTAQRELEEETGLYVPLDKFYLHKEVDKSMHSRPHTLFVFVADVDNFDGLLHIGNEGEHVALFSLDKIRNMRDFFPPHMMYIMDLFEEIA